MIQHKGLGLLADVASPTNYVLLVRVSESQCEIRLNQPISYRPNLFLTSECDGAVRGPYRTCPDEKLIPRFTAHGRTVRNVLFLFARTTPVHNPLLYSYDRPSLVLTAALS